MRGKRSVDARELGRVAAERFEFARAVFEHRLHDVADQAFAQRHHVFQVRVGRFRFEHPEFGEVAARLGFFRAKGRPEGVDLAERHGRRFDVELAGLREVGFLVVDVLDFEKRGGAFAGGRREDGRFGQDVALRIHVFVRGANGFGANAQDRGLARRANPEMPVVQQEIDAVLFQLDRIGRVVRDALHDFDRGDLNFESAGRALIGVNASR